MRADLYRRCALTCLGFAGETVDVRTKLVLFDMAQAWTNLANQAEKNSRLDLVYETPHRRPRLSGDPEHRPTVGNADY